VGEIYELILPAQPQSKTTDLLLTGRRSAGWEITGQLSKKFNGKTEDLFTIVAGGLITPI